MKKTFATICCLLGGCIIGFFANHLHSALGIGCFAAGILLLAVAIIRFSKAKKDE